MIKAIFNPSFTLIIAVIVITIWIPLHPSVMRRFAVTYLRAHSVLGARLIRASRLPERFRKCHTVTRDLRSLTHNVQQQKEQASTDATMNPAVNPNAA